MALHGENRIELSLSSKLKLKALCLSTGIRKQVLSQTWRCTPAIPVTQDADAGALQIQGQPWGGELRLSVGKALRQV